MIGQRNNTRHLTTLVVALFVTMSTHAEESVEVADPNAAVPATVYKSVFPTTSSASELDAPQFPWNGLYEPDGKFVSESTFDGMSASDEMMSEGEMSHDMSSGTMNHGVGMNLSEGTTDSRGVIEKIYSDDGKVKMKHGPIDRLEMPGMTMIFYVKDKALLDGLTEGDEVGFDVQMDGTGFYIIRFER